MLGTDFTLRSGHFLLLLLVTSSILLGFSYLNEMYQRIQLQTDIVIVERQTQHAASERLVIQNKAAQLQVKLEAANHESKRLQDMHEFQSMQQNAKFEKEKQDLLQTVSLKEKAIAELQDQYQSLKVRFDNLHSVMNHFEKNQSKLLEKFATQSTQCMNVISMMGELCNKSKSKIQKILTITKERNMTAVTNQSFAVKNKPVNISAVPRTDGGFSKAQMPLEEAITGNPFLLSVLGSKQRHLAVGPEVNDLSSEPENSVSPMVDQYNASVPKITAQERFLNVKEKENMTSTTVQKLVVLQNDSLKNEGDLNEKIIIKNYTNQNYTKQQRTKEKRLLDSYKSNQNMFENVSYSEHGSENEGSVLKNLSLHLTNASKLTTSRDIMNVTQDDGEKLNLTSLEYRKPGTSTGKRATKETSIFNLEKALNFFLGVDNTEEMNKDGDIEEEKIKYDEKHLTDTGKENHEKILQTLKIKHTEKHAN